MKKLGLIIFASLVFAACNNTGDETKSTDSTTIQDNTKIVTPLPADSGKIMIDSGMKKDSNKKY